MSPRVPFMAAVLALALPAAGTAEPAAGPAAPALRGAVEARIDAAYAVGLFSDGRKTMVPLSSLKAGDRAWLEALAAGHPLARGNSKMTVVASALPVKKTLERS